MISLSLPYPPSANRLWRNFNGRSIKSAEYRKWSDAASIAILQAKIGKSFGGPYHLEIQAVRPDRRARDIDNIIKPVGDAIAAAGLVRNDSDAQSIKASWAKGEPIKGGAIHVWLWAA
jgi:crossover junction endodeoxyribonuclease RusA